MAIDSSIIASSVYAQSYKPEDKKIQNLGKTIGEPKLSKEAQKYYDDLKKEFGNYDFVLVSEDQVENAQAKAEKFANAGKTLVLIDEDKIERMATDESYRKKYEGIIRDASAQLDQLKASVERTGANVGAYGIQVNDDGTTSFFAVMKQASMDQKERIEKAAEKKKVEKKEAQKLAEKKEEEKAAEKKKEENRVLTANSIEELLNKINDYTFSERSDSLQTKEEKLIGQHVDFKG